MRVTKVKGSGIKGGQDFEYELAPVTLLWGPNWAGKTAVINALQLALTGQVPGLPTKPGELLKALSPEWCGAILAEVACDDGACVRREWRRDTKSAKYVGPEDPTVPLVLLDPAQFFGLTGPARSRFLYKCAPLPAEFDDIQKMADALCAAAKGIRVEDHDAEAEAAVSKVVQSIAEFAVSHRTFAPQEWLTILQEKVRNDRNSMSDSVERLEKTTQGLVQVGAQQQVNVNTAAEAEYEAARKLLSDAEQRVAELEAQVDDKDVVLHGLDESLAKVHNGTAVANELEAKSLLRCQLEATLEQLRETSDATENIDELKENVGRLMGVMVRAEMKANATGDAAKKADEAFKALADLKQCPTCRQKVTKASLKPLVATAKKAAQRCKAEDKDARAAHKKARDEYLAELKVLQAWERLDEVSAEVEVLAAQAAVAGSAESVQAEIAKASAERDALVDQHAAAVAAAQSAQEAADRAHEAYKALLAHRAEQKAKGESARQAKTQRVQLQVLRKLHTVVSDLLARIVEATVGSLLARANQLCGELVPDRLAYCDETIYAVKPESAVSYSHRTFSGAQAAMSYASLCVALAAGTPSRVMLFDEMSRFDDLNRVKLVEHLCRLVKRGELDQAVLVDVRPLGGVTELLFKEIRVGE